MQKKKLHRSGGDRMLGGVIGGLAEYFGTDSSILRLLALLGLFLTGLIPGAILYLVALVIVPSDHVEPHTSS